MATIIETLKKQNGDYVLPRTRAKAVSMEDGTTVETAFSDLKTLVNNMVNISEQSLTEEQKEQVRKNIGAISIDDILSIIQNGEGVKY